MEVLNQMRRRNNQPKPPSQSRVEPDYHTPPPPLSLPPGPQDLDELRDQERVEGDIAELLSGMTAAHVADSYGVKGITASPPEVAVQQSNAEKVIQLTSEAVITQYEAAAKSVEELRLPLMAWSAAHKQAVEEIDAAMKLIDETAQRFRDHGKTTSELYQKTSLAVANVNKTCNDVLKTIERPA